MSVSAHLGGAGLPDVSQAAKILAATSITTGVALATVLARLYVRVFIIRNVGLDDYIMLLTMLLSLSGFAIIIPEVIYGAGRHTVYVGKTAVLAMHLNFATQAIYMWAIGLVKISIGLFLLRFAPRKGYKIFIWVVIVLMLLYTTICFFTLIFQCEDMRSIWDMSVKSKCFKPIQLLTLSYTNTALNILTDLIFAILPAFMLRHLQVNRRNKASLVCILGLGVFACAAAIVKVSFLPNYGRTGDLLWDYSTLTIWVVVESNMGIIAGSLPTLKPLFKKVLDTYGSRSKTPYLGDSKPHKLHSLSRSHQENPPPTIPGRLPPTTSPYNSEYKGPYAMPATPATPSSVYPDSDHSSEEYILSARDDTNSIMLTTEVTVSHAPDYVSQAPPDPSGARRYQPARTRYDFDNMNMI
ncbi:hypothetical protein BO71DRAFT_367420 [Aspergillus ellipticus CBS 707.79]|uniref:Rhodopsin domain-containing protein n=1 Tax=Aspergillus ellipticus CBS 707.79 TaxID=1448320 RepID=A0A319D8N3_9EURO|nr:hypothetical protein BO71DRAFT_367420 [Aspergillus ellipticus CBS 707.79]